MATAPNSPFKSRPKPEIPSTLDLEALPFPAALLDPDAVFAAVNTEWRSLNPGALPGESCLGWCQATHPSDPALRARLLAGIQDLFGNSHHRFVQDYPGADGRHRITVSRVPTGALILQQDLGNGGEPLGSGDGDRRSHKMEAIGRLVGGVAHDFANLLTLIEGYSEILLSRVTENDPLRPDLGEIRKAAHHGSRLTAQLLGYTRGQPAETRPIDLNGLIFEMQNMLRPIIGEYIDLETALSPDLHMVVADPSHMEQVIMNLILNARDAMPSGGRIRIETRNTRLDERSAQAHGMRPGPSVTLSICDTGHGIDAETMRRIFEPFFTTKPEGKGTGLGLSTVHSIVRQTGGEVGVRSTPGQGSAFTVCLPSTGQPAESRESPAAAVSAAPGNETILLVEDEDAVRRLLAHILRKHEYEVLEAACAEEALRIFDARGDGIHLVLTDMVMPRVTGRELAERLRAVRPDLKVVFMSGYTNDVLLSTGALGPGMSFLPKPLRPDVLATRIREALDSDS